MSYKKDPWKSFGYELDSFEGNLKRLKYNGAFGVADVERFLEALLQQGIKCRHRVRGGGACPLVYLVGRRDTSPDNPKPAVGDRFIETWLAGIFRQRRVITDARSTGIAFQDRPEIKEKLQQQFVAEQNALAGESGSVLRDGQIPRKPVAQDAPGLGGRVFHT
jgi:hypothetical protein